MKVNTFILKRNNSCIPSEDNLLEGDVTSEQTRLSCHTETFLHPQLQRTIEDDLFAGRCDKRTYTSLVSHGNIPASPASEDDLWQGDVTSERTDISYHIETFLHRLRGRSFVGPGK